MKYIKNWFKLIRMKHWVKNFIVFLPMFFRGDFTAKTIGQSVVAFVSFSLLASAIYIVNDVMDVEKDRKHPTKCKRPIAAGTIKVSAAMVGHFVLLAGGILVLVFGKVQFLFAASMLYIGYYGINLFYSMKGKNIPLLDIVILASGFLLRLFYGSVATGISISEWLYLVITSGAFYLGLSKRRNELVRQSKAPEDAQSREVLKYYNYQFLDKNMNMCLTLVIVFYTLWCTEYGDKSTYLLSTIPLILIIAMKYSLNIEKEGADGDPTDTIMGDKVLLLLVAVLAALMFVILYIV